MATSDIGIRIGLQGAETVTSGLQRVQASMGQLSGQVDTVRTALSTLAPTLAGALSVGGLVAFVRSTVNAIDAMNDLADATGASIEEISKLDQVARRNGQSLDQVGGILVKFNAQLKEADGKNGASIALQAIGLEAAKLRQLDPAEALRQTAVALAGFADDANKARIVQELFGKSVREAAPFLKDLAEAGELNASVTAQQAAEAEKFNKQLFAFQANVADAQRVIVGALLPTISEVLKGFESSSQSTEKFAGAIEFLRVPIEALSILGANVAFVFQGVGREIGAIAAQAKALATGDLAGFRAIGQAVTEDARQARAELEAFEQRVLNARRLAQQAVQSAVPPAAKPAALDIAAEQARRKAADESAAALLKQQEAYDKLRTSIDERISAGQQELQQGTALSEAQRLQIKLNADLAAGLVKLTPAQKAVLDGKLAELDATERQLASDKEAAKGAKALADARVEARRAEERAIAEFEQRERETAAASLASVNERIKNLRDEAQIVDKARELNISLAEAIELVAIERLKEKQAQFQEGSEPYLAVEREIQARQRLAGLIGNRATLEANRRAADEAARDWERVTQAIGDGLTDALMRGGKSAADYLKNLFRQLVLRPIVQAVVNPIVGAVTGSLGGSNAMGTLGGINSLASLGSAITGSFTGSIANVIGSAGTMFGSSALTAFSAGMKGATLAPGLMGPTTAGATGAMGAGASAAAAIPYVAAVLAVLNVAGVFRSKSIVGGGLTGTLGAGDIQSYDLQRRGGTLLSGPDYSLVNQKLSTESQAIQAAYEALRTNAAKMAESLGLSGDAVRTFTTRLGNDVLQNDLSARGIKLDSLTPEQAAAKVQEALSQANEDLAAFVLGASRTVTETLTQSIESWSYGEQGDTFNGFVDQVTEVTRTIEATGVSYRREGETNVQTLQRLAGSLGTINPALDQLGLNLYATSLAGADLASQLADAFGGLEAFGQASAGYYAEFYTEAERTAKTTEQLTKALGGLGISLPTTRDAYRQLVEAQDLNTEAGRKNVAVLVQLSGTFAGITPVVEDLADAGENASETLRSVADILRERQGLERQLLQLQGDTVTIRAQERAALDESNQALYDQITALQDKQAADAAAAEATRAAAAEAQRIGQERIGLERQLLQLQGNTTALRAAERAALDESNRALYDQITALQDKQAADAAAAEATRAAAAEAQRIGQERIGLERQLLQLQGNTTAIRAAERAALDASNQALYDRITALQDSQAAEAAAAEAARAAAAEAQRVAQERQGLQRQLLQVQGDTAALRALERTALDASNRALFDQITALQDSQAAAEAAAAAQRDYNAAVETAQGNLERARSAVSSAQSGVESVREAATNAYLAAQDRVLAAQERVTALNTSMAVAARDAALRMRELGASLQDFVSGEFTAPDQAFAGLLRKALGGDSEAMRGLPDAARAAIDLARSNARTASEAATERARILSSVAEVAAAAAATPVPATQEADPMAAATQELAAAQTALADALSVANAIGAPLTRQVEDLLVQFKAAGDALTKALADQAAAAQVLANIERNTFNTVTEVKSLSGIAAKAELEVQLKAVAESVLPDEIKALIADKGKTYTATITAVVDSALSEQEKALLLQANTSALRSVVMSAAFSNELTSDQQKALQLVDETVTKTIKAALTSGTLTDEQRQLLSQQEQAVTKIVQALVDTGQLTEQQKKILGLTPDSPEIAYTAVIRAVLDSGLSEQEKVLLLNAKTSANRAVLLSASFANVLTSDQQKALQLVDETVTKTINAAVSSGTLTDEQRKLLGQQEETVTKTVQALVDTGKLTEQQKLLLGLSTGSLETSYTAIIKAVLDSTLSEQEKVLLLNANTTVARAVLLSASFASGLTSDQQKALQMVNETVTKTIQAAVTTGTLTDEQRQLLAQQAQTVTKTVQALVDTGKLTEEQKKLLGLLSSATTSTLTLTGTVTFDPSNALQSVFNNISASNALLARVALAQISPTTSTVGQKASAYAGLRAVYTDADTRKIVEVQFGPQTDSAWEALKKAAGFALGGVFTNGLVTSPTAFPMGLMGEAGPEAIMPLGRSADGSLGVRMFSDSNRREEMLVAEIRALRAEMVDLRAEARSTAVATNKTARILDRVSPDGTSLQTVAAA